MGRAESPKNLEKNEGLAEMTKVVNEALEMSKRDFVKREQCSNETGPSWLPQFLVQEVLQSPFVNDQLFEDRGFTAGIAFPSKLDYAAIQQFDDLKILSLSGFIFDRVTYILMPQGVCIDKPAVHRTGFEAVCSIMGSGFEDISNEPLIDAYWKTLTCDQLHRGSIVAELLPIRDPVHFQDLAHKLSTEEGDKCVSSQDRDSLFHCLKLLHNRGRFGFVSEYCLAMLPAASMEDDIVCIFYGGKSPMVIRPVNEDEDEDKDRCILIGPAYIHGLMDGKALQLQVPGENARERTVQRT
jgi:hypothetical protein